jgi:hypothetical protein
VDGKRFDDVIRRMGTTRLTRLRALQGLAAATAVGLIGGSVVSDETAAANRNRSRTRKVCHCGDNNPQRIGCTTKRIKCKDKDTCQKKVKRHLKRHEFDTKGTCPTTTTTPVAVTPAPAPVVPTGPGCLSQPEATRCPGEVCCGLGNKKVGTCKPNAKAC